MNIRQALYAWRADEAAKRAVELFRVLPSSALDEIVKVLPKTKEELIAIKGIKEAKYQLYGKTIFAIIEEYGGNVSPVRTVHSEDEGGDMPRIGKSYLFEKQDEHVFSVGSYLDIVNNALWRLSARVKGEVTSFKFQGSALYLTIKDADDQSTMRVFMWISDFDLAGIELRDGVEVVIQGKSEVYKPTGGLSFRAETIELVGEGALKAAYEKLKKTLEGEGLFGIERKRQLPEFPERIGLITSRDGAVIHDFLNNLGRFGFHIRFMDSRVEGAMAVRDILAALNQLKHETLDVLVVIRGGGSLESLQAFNNERVVRAIATFPVPVVCAIGHDKDVPLAQLVADFAPSTPTACTALLNTPWEEVKTEFRSLESGIIHAEGTALLHGERVIIDARALLFEKLSYLRAVFSDASTAVVSCVPVLARAIEGYKTVAQDTLRSSSLRYRSQLGLMSDTLTRFSSELKSRDPLRLLRLGYSIISQDRKILRSVAGIAKGDYFEARLSDGTLKAEVRDITPN